MYSVENSFLLPNKMKKPNLFDIKPIDDNYRRLLIIRQVFFV